MFAIANSEPYERIHFSSPNEHSIRCTGLFIQLVRCGDIESHLLGVNFIADTAALSMYGHCRCCRVRAINKAYTADQTKIINTSNSIFNLSESMPTVKIISFI